MRKFLITLLSVALSLSLLGGCATNADSKNNSQGNSSNSVTSNGSDANANTQGNNSQADETSNKKPASSKVFKANELLTPEEVAAIVGTEVTLQEDSLEIDPETGKSFTYYKYDYNSSTSISGLFLLKQNAAVTQDKLVGNTAEDDFNRELLFAGSYAEPLSGLGDKAFVHSMLTQVFVLYGDYFIFVGFNGDSDEKGKEVNIAIAKKILENLDKKL